jgi:hypothetical protein
MRRLDYKKQLVDYFKKNISSKKYDADTLKFALYNQGYSRVAVDSAYDIAVKDMAKTAPVLKEKPVIKHEIYDMNDNPINVEPMGFWEKFWNRVKGNRV